MMREYHKIETLFGRDTTGSKKLIPGKWRNETEVRDRMGRRVIVKIKTRDFA